MTPVVWVGGLCGVVTDAMPGTRHGDESECDHCGSECVSVASEASEYDAVDPDEEEIDPSDADLEVECALLAGVTRLPPWARRAK